VTILLFFGVDGLSDSCRRSHVASWAIERMQIALILGYQKSVNLHTLNRLDTWRRATGVEHKIFAETTGSALPRSLHSWVFIG
jgi:hypothetical protein